MNENNKFPYKGYHMYKKTFKIILNVLLCLLIVVNVFFMLFTLSSVFLFDKKDASLFGYRFFIVQSDSMSATDFSAGDLIITKQTDPALLSAGDIITFISENRSSYGKTVTHKIRMITANEKGEPCFVTYGTTTNSDDETTVTYDTVIGKYAGKISGAGNLFAFLKTTPGYIVCIFVPFLLLIISYGIKIALQLKKTKHEQDEAALAERKELEEANKKVEELNKRIEELEKIKETDKTDQQNAGMQAFEDKITGKEESL